MQEILDSLTYFYSHDFLSTFKASFCVQGRGLSRFPGAARRESEIQIPTISFLPVNLKCNQRYPRFNLEFFCEIYYLWVLHQVVVDHWVNIWLEEWDWIPKIISRHFLWITWCYPGYPLIFLANGRLSNFGEPPNRIFWGVAGHCSALCGAVVLCLGWFRVINFETPPNSKSEMEIVPQCSTSSGVKKLVLQDGWVRGADWPHPY